MDFMEAWRKLVPKQDKNDVARANRFEKLLKLWSTFPSFTFAGSLTSWIPLTHQNKDIVEHRHLSKTRSMRFRHEI